MFPLFDPPQKNAGHRSDLDQWPYPCLAIMATNMDILGVAAEWEAIRSIRDRVRDRGVLFEDFVGGKKMECNIHGAEYHAEILLPVLKKLVDPESGDVGMCGIPALEKEFLVHLLY